MAYADVDLGEGFGVPVFSCHLDSKTRNTTANIFAFKAPGIYDVKLPYFYLGEDQPNPIPEEVNPPVKQSEPTLRITPIIGGSERETDYDTLLESINRHQLNQSDFQWYLDLRKYGSVPHSGFGLGLERMVAWICVLKHVRETIPFPRLLHRLRP